MDTPERGLVLNPVGEWDGKDRNFLLVIRGRCDSEYAKDPTRKSVGGHVVRLNEAPVAMSCRAHRMVSLSVTEAELFQAVECSQDMLYVY